MQSAQIAASSIVPALHCGVPSSFCWRSKRVISRRALGVMLAQAISATV